MIPSVIPDVKGGEEENSQGFVTAVSPAEEVSGLVVCKADNPQPKMFAFRREYRLFGMFAAMWVGVGMSVANSFLRNSECAAKSSLKSSAASLTTTYQNDFIVDNIDFNSSICGGKKCFFRLNENAEMDEDGSPVGYLVAQEGRGRFSDNRLQRFKDTFDLANNLARDYNVSTLFVRSSPPRMLSLNSSSAHDRNFTRSLNENLRFINETNLRKDHFLFDAPLILQKVKVMPEPNILIQHVYDKDRDLVPEYREFLQKQPGTRSVAVCDQVYKGLETLREILHHPRYNCLRHDFQVAMDAQGILHNIDLDRCSEAFTASRTRVSKIIFLNKVERDFEAAFRSFNITCSGMRSIPATDDSTATAITPTAIMALSALNAKNLNATVTAGSGNSTLRAPLSGIPTAPAAMEEQNSNASATASTTLGNSTATPTLVQGTPKDKSSNAPATASPLPDNSTASTTMALGALRAKRPNATAATTVATSSSKGNSTTTSTKELAALRGTSSNATTTSNSTATTTSARRSLKDDKRLR